MTTRALSKKRVPRFPVGGLCSLGSRSRKQIPCSTLPIKPSYHGTSSPHLQPLSHCIYDHQSLGPDCPWRSPSTIQVFTRGMDLPALRGRMTTQATGPTLTNERKADPLEEEICRGQCNTFNNIKSSVEPPDLVFLYQENLNILTRKKQKEIT